MMIKKQQQLIKHNPKKNKWGDCYRTCFAIILNKDAKDVPHFLDNDNQNANKDAKIWLKEQGFGLFSWYYEERLIRLNAIIQHHKEISPGVPFILTGKSPRECAHCVVVLDGKIVCDPFTGEEGNEDTFIGPCDGGYFWTEVITVTVE